MFSIYGNHQPRRNILLKVTLCKCIECCLPTPSPSPYKIYFCTQIYFWNQIYNQIIYNQRTMTCNTINILLVHKQHCKHIVGTVHNLQNIPWGCHCIPLHISYECYQKTRHLGIYKKIYFPKLSA